MGYGSSTPIIPVKVVDLGHDDRFVIAKQNVLRRRSPDNPKDTYMERKRPNNHPLCKTARRVKLWWGKLRHFMNGFSGGVPAGWRQFRNFSDFHARQTFEDVK